MKFQTTNLNRRANQIHALSQAMMSRMNIPEAESKDPTEFLSPLRNLDDAMHMVLTCARLTEEEYDRQYPERYRRLQEEHYSPIELGALRALEAKHKRQESTRPLVLPKKRVLIMKRKT